MDKKINNIYIADKNVIHALIFKACNPAVAQVFSSSQPACSPLNFQAHKPQLGGGGGGGAKIRRNIGQGLRALSLRALSPKAKGLREKFIYILAGWLLVASFFRSGFSMVVQGFFDLARLFCKALRKAFSCNGFCTFRGVTNLL